MSESYEPRSSEDVYGPETQNITERAKSEVCATKSADALTLELGSNLIKLVDLNAKDSLLKKIPMARQLFRVANGFAMPWVNIVEGSDLAVNRYRILVYGLPAWEGYTYQGMLLAVPQNLDADEFCPSIDALESAAYWIVEKHLVEASNLGCSVFSHADVIAIYVVKIAAANFRRIV